MKIIPVIDVCNGQVVHAKSGHREQYKPVQSKLCKSALPVPIVQAFLELYPFEIIYIADLDAIRGNGNNLDCIQEITKTFKNLQIWLDNNRMDTGNIPGKQITTVIGSESGINDRELEQLPTQHDPFVLSLDYRQGDFLGDQSLLSGKNSWPEDIILLNLSLVGSSMGPDTKLIKSVQAHAPGRRIYYGGGIRNKTDIVTLDGLGLDGVLVATLLHNGLLDQHQVKEIHSLTQ